MSFFFPFLIPFLKAEKRYGTQVERSDWKYNAKYKNIAANTIWLCLQTGLQLCTLGLYQWSLSPLHSDSSAQPLPFDLHRVWRGWVPQAAQAPWEIRRWSWVTHPYSYSTRSAAHKQVFVFIVVTPMCQKMSQQRRTPAWLNREVELRERKKGEFMTFGRRGRQLRRTTRTSWGYAGKKLEGPKRNKNLIRLLE